jgi:hypothetical protein
MEIEREEQYTERRLGRRQRTIVGVTSIAFIAYTQPLTLDFKTRNK